MAFACSCTVHADATVRGDAWAMTTASAWPTYVANSRPPLEHRKEESMRGERPG